MAMEWSEPERTVPSGCDKNSGRATEVERLAIEVADAMGEADPTRVRAALATLPRPTLLALRIRLR